MVKKRDYPHQRMEDIRRLANIVIRSDELLTKAGFPASSAKFNGVKISRTIPPWMDAITILWLERGTEIPEREFMEVIRAGMRGDFDAVDMFFFTWGQ